MGTGARIASAISAAGTNEARHVTVGDVRRPAELSRLVGIDVRGFKHSVSNQAIAHALAKHGTVSEIGRGQKPVTREDFQKIPTILKSGAYSTARQRLFGPPRVQIAAEIDGSRYHYVGEVRRRQKRIDMITMWKK